MPSEKDNHPQGGSLSDMAVDGTTVPADSAKPRIIPSVPRPDQIVGSNVDSQTAGGDSLASAADNSGVAPISTKDGGFGDQPITGTGDSLPAGVDSKRLHNVGSGDASKGHPRDDKQTKQSSAI